MSKLPDLPQKVVLDWIDSNKVSIEDLEIISNEEDRFQGAVVAIKTGNKLHRAVVRLISSDQEALDKMEDKVISDIDKRKDSSVSNEVIKKTRSQRHKRTLSPNALPGSAVSSALGEKVKPSPAQAVPVKKAKKSSRAAQQAQEDARTEIDTRVINSAKKKLFQIDSTVKKTTADDDDDESIASDIDANNISSNKCDDSEGEKESSEDEMTRSQLSQEDDDESNQDGGDEEVEDTADCKHCGKLRTAGNSSVSDFLSSLSDFLSAKDLSKKKGSENQQYVEVLPIAADQPKCLLSKGYKVYITVHDKNAIKNEANGNPSKIVRETLVKLFGRDAIETKNITALGTRQGSLGIRKEIREALLAFAHRNRAPPYAALSSAKMNQIINKKKNQVHRTKDVKVKVSPSSSKQMTSPKPKRAAQPKPKADKKSAHSSDSISSTGKHQTPRKNAPVNKMASPISSPKPLGNLSSSGSMACTPSSPWKVNDNLSLSAAKGATPVKHMGEAHSVSRTFPSTPQWQAGDQMAQLNRGSYQTGGNQYSSAGPFQQQQFMPPNPSWNYQPTPSNSYTGQMFNNYSQDFQSHQNTNVNCGQTNFNHLNYPGQGWSGHSSGYQDPKNQYSTVSDTSETSLFNL